MILSQEGGAALDAALWDLDEDEADGGRLRSARSGRAAGGGDKGTQSRGGAHTNDTADEENAYCGASSCGARGCPGLARPTFVSASHAESQRLGTFGAVATSMCAHPSLGKFLKFCNTSLCMVAWICHQRTPSLLRPDVRIHPDAPEMFLTPTLEITTCDMVRRQTKEKRFGNESPSNPERTVSSAGNAVHGHATQQARELFRICIVAA